MFLDISFRLSKSQPSFVFFFPSAWTKRSKNEIEGCTLRRHIVGFILISLPGCFKHNKFIPKAKWEEVGEGKNSLNGWLEEQEFEGSRMVGDRLETQHPKLLSAVPWMSPSNLLLKFTIKFAAGWRALCLCPVVALSALSYSGWLPGSISHSWL